MCARSSVGDSYECFFFFSSRRRHTRSDRDWSSDVCSSDLFGEMALIDDEPRSAHVIAMEDSTLLVLRREDFQGILKQTPGIALALLRELSRRLRRVDEKVGSLVLLDVNGRVAQLLLDLADEAGSEKITRRLNHQTIAQMIRSSRENVNPTMRRLVDKGYIGIRPREILIRDRSALEA